MHSKLQPTRPAVRSAALLLVTVVIMGSCGGSTVTTTTPPGSVPTTAPSPPTTTSQPVSPTVGEAAVVLAVEVVGGCAMMGPNCPAYVLWSDGRAIAVRGLLNDDPFETRIDDEIVERVGFIDPALTAELIDVVRDTDLDAVLAAVGPGTCNACVDGVDLLVRVATPGGVQGVSSVEHDFDRAVPFFDLVSRVVDALSDELPLDIVAR